MPPKRKCRQYSQDYLSFGFIESPNDNRLPFCLICKHTFSNEAMKPSRLRDHLQTMHPDKKDKSVEFFKHLLNQFNTRPTIPVFLKNETT
jgi:hypothetical protein